MRSYWKIRINHSRVARKFRGHDLFFCTDNPTPDSMIPLEAVADRMMHSFELASVECVMKISQQEYAEHMWE